MRHGLGIPGRKSAKHKIHFVAVNKGYVPDVGETFAPKAFARTLCGQHYDATGWERPKLGDANWREVNWCRNCA